MTGEGQQPAGRQDVGTDANRSGIDALEQLTDEVLPALMARLADSGLGELEVAQGAWRVRLRRHVAMGAEHPERRATDRQAAGRGAVAVGPSASAGFGSGTGAPSNAGASAGGSSSASRSSVVRRTALSPAVGYFTPRAGLGTGQAVRSGDRIGSVDVLGVSHDVVAPVDGVVGRVLVTTGEAVEYGQELVRIDGIERLAES